jgi:glycosyltransferase involved in cell wall biosynthesis
MKYALKQGFPVVLCFDADGQHQAEDIPGAVNALIESNADMVIGSRYCDGRAYTGPFNRRVGQQIFSRLTQILLGCRIYDTTSGFKAMKASTCENLIHGTFMDFHVETIVRLSMSGFSIIEHPITVKERKDGSSMYTSISSIVYPLKTLLLTFVAIFDGYLSRRKR